jgi:CHAT domain-containing protein
MIFSKTSLQSFLIILVLLTISAFQINLKIIKNKDAQELIKAHEILIEEAKYELAIEKLLAAKELLIQQKSWSDAVACLNETASISEGYLYDNDLKATFNQEALAIVQKHLPNIDANKAKAIRIKGELYYYNRQTDSSIHFLQSALNDFQQLQLWEEKAWCNILLTTCYDYQLDYQNVKKNLDEAEKLANQHELSSMVFDVIYNNMGAYYFNINDYKKAILYTERSVSLILVDGESSLSEDDLYYLSDLYNNLGVYHEKKGDLSRSEYYYNQSLKINKELNLSIETLADIYLNHGNVKLKLKDYDAVIHICQTIIQHDLSALPPKEQYRILNLSYKNLAIAYLNQNQYDSAIYCIDNAIHYHSKKKTTLNFNNLIIKGEILHRLGKNKEAIAIVQNAIPSYNHSLVSLINKHQNLHYCFNTLGKIYLQEKKYNLALQSFQAALALNVKNSNLSENINESPTIHQVYRIDYLVESLENKANALKAINTQKSIEQAYQHNTLAIQWVEKMRQEMAFEESKIELNKSTNRIYKSSIVLAAQLYKITDNKKYLEEAFKIAEKQKATILLESLINKKEKNTLGVPQILLNRERDLKHDIAYYQQQLLDTEIDSATASLYQGYFNNNNLALAGLKDTLSTFYQGYFNLEYQTSIATIPNIQKDLLKDNQALIQFTEIDSSLYVFAIELGNSQLFILPYGKKQQATLKLLEKHLSSREYILNHPETVLEEFSALSQQTYATLFEPVLKELTTTPESFIIVADGALNFLPFEVLLDSKVAENENNFIQMPYLMKKYQFHYGYSGTMLLQNKKNYQTIKTNNRLLAFAPRYESINNESIASRGDLSKLRDNMLSLEGTAKEIKAIAPYFKGLFDFSETATEKKFKNTAADYGILHLAMHGKADLNDSDLAHLIFSNVEEDSVEDGKLHHFEIANLDLNAQLAVLSACETGVGKDVVGEGVMSLGRSFMYAGVPTVVMSLWKLDDLAASDLMPKFYKNLADGMNKDQALHQAKLTYLENATLATAHPFFWSGIISIGDSQPIKNSSNYSLSLILGALVIGLAIVGIYFYSKKSKLS